ncbi:MAG: hypothetical protein EOO50_04405 [Flavobacterium sp.]|uniref:N-acetylmuramoyl-L-alanine amidase family protein n=1 Tax=Flavobacterium sp. TaxID=239 RepID=UPI0012270FAB|nr:N-acetylmuramoyl-L-alanine amidase [Flavobacterium sp.]RZJ67824.1 MAG: hypothetical protein EOO50_04405 [Flavobacterium sp.]
MKKSLAFIAAGIIAISFGFARHEKFEDPKKIQIVIDAGHGGNDAGAQFEGYSEKEIVAQITKKIKDMNRSENVNITLTRPADIPVTLQQRTDIINTTKPDIVISLHVGSSLNPEKSGVTLYVAKENTSKERASLLARKLGDRIRKNHDFKVDEIQEAPFFVLSKSEAPGIVLQLGYLSNDFDRHYLTDDKQQSRIARTILECVNDLK